MFSGSKDKRSKLVIVLLLILTTVAVYAQTASFEFTRHDDNYFVTENQVVQQGLSVENLIWAVTSVEHGTWSPTTWISHMLDCQLFGLTAGWHHLVNVGWHLANSLLLFFLLNRFTGSTWRSGLVAALFALHPLHVESVAWIAERRDVLSTFFWLLTMWVYGLWVARRTVAGYLLVVCCLALGLMAKPMLVSLPIVLLLWDIWPLQRLAIKRPKDLWGQRQTIARLIFEKIILLGLSIVSGLLNVVASELVGGLGSLREYPMAFRAGNALIAYARYLLMTVWPIDLVPHYPYPVEISLVQAAFALALLAFVTWQCLRRMDSQPYLMVGWFWFIISLLPVIGLIQQGAAFALADRYSYVPLIGVFIMFAWGGTDLAAQRGWARHWLFSVAGVLVLACAVLSFRQTAHWRDTKTLFSYTLQVDPENHIALQQLGVDYREDGQFDPAYRYLSEDARLNPNDFDALANLAQLLEKMGRFDEAISYYLQALERSPNNYEVFVHLGIIHATKGDFPGAEANFGKAIALQPDNPMLRLNLGSVYSMQRKFSEAERQFSMIINATPRFAEAYNALGLVKQEQGRWDEAITNFQAALRIKPDYQKAQANLQAAQERRRADKK